MELAAAIGAFTSLAVNAAQIYSKLSTLAYQFSFARFQILRVAQDVSGVEAAIHQLSELLKDEELPRYVDPNNKSRYLIQNLSSTCRSLFESIEKSLRDASKQIKAKGLSPGVEITLTHAEQALWPFHHDKVESLMKELDAVKTTLMLVSQMTTLSLVKRLATSSHPRSKDSLHHVDEGDKELLYRAIYSSLQDPQIKSILHNMSAQPPIGSSINDETDLVQGTGPSNNSTDKYLASTQNERGPQNERGLEEDDCDGMPAVPDGAVHRHSNTLLRIMQQRPSKIPRVLQNSPSGRPEWSRTSHSRPASKFHKMEAQSVFWKVVNGYGKQKDRYKAIPGVNRRAYLFMPQLHQDPQNTSVTYKVTEIELSQSEIADALSYWSACKSGAQHFNPAEPSQKQALDQIEAERGKLFPARFIIESIQYTNPRIFSTTAALLKSHDILVVVDELRPQTHQEHNSGRRLRRHRMKSLPIPHFRSKSEYPVGHTYFYPGIPNEIHTTELDVQDKDQLLEGVDLAVDFTASSSKENFAENYVDKMIKEFGIPLLHKAA